MFRGLTDKPVLEELRASRTSRTYFCLLVRPEDTVYIQIASNPTLAENAVMSLFGNAGGQLLLRQDIKVLSAILIVINRSIGRVSQSSSFEHKVQLVLQNHSTEPEVDDKVAIRFILAPFSQF